VIGNNGHLSATTIVDNIGTSQSLYLSVKFLQTGFSSSSFTVSIAVNRYIVCTGCTVNTLCGEEYVECCYNQDITYALDGSVGGSLLEDCSK
jgi:hypothetical protein